MPPARTVAALLCAALLGVPGAAWAQSGGGAGDDQYQDPFGSAQATTPAKRPVASRSQSSGGTSTGLSQTPNLGTSGTRTTPTTTATPSTPAAAPSAAPAGRQLPNTGSDPRLAALAGLALLLCGIGLRLRTADGRF